MNDIEQLKDDLYNLCRYDSSEPNYVKYNLSILTTIDKMSMESILFALEDFKNVNS